MKELPLLSSDFKKFSWEKSVGKATDEELLRSYQAIVNKDYTFVFSRYVWNDLIDLLSKAITDAGLTWDNTYGSADETKMMWLFSPLTSSRFNAVTLNISKLINYTWRWEVDEETTGYIGRLRVYGAKEIGSKADIVYGWYILELARVINLFIDILKNEANFGEFPSHNIIPMVDYCKPRSADAKGVIVNDIIKTIHEVTVRNATSNPIEMYDTSKTIDSVTLSNQQGRPMKHGYIIKSLDYMNMASLICRRMNHKDIMNSISYSNVLSRKGVPLELKEDAIGSPNDCIVANPQGVPMNHQNIMNVIDSTIVTSAYPKYFSHEGTINTIDSVKVWNVYPKYLTHDGSINTIDSTILSAKESAKLSAKEIAKTIDSVIVDAIKPAKVVAKEIFKTISHCILETEWTWLYPIQKGTNLYIRQVYSSDPKENELFIDCDNWLNPIQNGSNLYIRQMYDSIKE